MQAKHYFFKFMPKNYGLQKWLDLNDTNVLCPLGIYFDEDDGKNKSNKVWEFDKNWDDENSKAGPYSITRNSETTRASQIKLFCNIDGSLKEHYFWLFAKKEIYCFSPEKNIIHNTSKKKQNESNKWKYIHKILGKGDKKIEVKRHSFPKYIECKHKETFKKIRLPEIFTGINANQKYNRKTIAKLGKEESQIADYLIFGEQVEVTERNYIEYLSPTEFETLIFLIFNDPKIGFCSSFRGGTLPLYDLRVRLNKTMPNFKKKEFWIQVKKKAKGFKYDDGDDSLFLFYTGYPDLEKRKFGKQWISSQVESNRSIQRWLKEMVFDYPVYDTRGLF